jgi:hypothetical protein
VSSGGDLGEKKTKWSAFAAGRTNFPHNKRRKLDIDIDFWSVLVFGNCFFDKRQAAGAFC